MLRNIFVSSLVVVSLFLVGTGCKKTYNYSLDQTVSPVANLFSPQDSILIVLNPASGAEVTFQWAPALAADGSLVQYEIAFGSSANFKTPLFKTASDATGTSTSATITHSQLNQIAKMAGIANLDTGTLYWTVYSTKGLNDVPATQTRMLTVVRPAGFDTIPSDLYLTGSATEGGTALSSAVHFKQTSPGVFELYTSLTNGGTYQFVNSKSGTPVSYFMVGANLKLSGSDNYTDTTAQVRFNLDFNNAVGSVTVIRSVDVWYAAFDNVEYHFIYNGNSTWIDQDQLVQMPSESYGLDERYKFRFTVNYGGGAADTYEWYGSSNSDNSEPTSSTPASYFYLTPVTNDQWNNCYKFSIPLNNGIQNTITVFMQPDASYTHTVVPQ
jgi:hypothetical protein